MGRLSSMNIRAAVNAGAVLHLVDFEERTPLHADDGTPISITLLGKDSDVFLAAERAATTKQVEARQEGAKWSAAESDHLMNQTFAKCTLGWRNIPMCWLEPFVLDAEGAIVIDETGAPKVNEDETPAPFSQENALKLYGQPGVRWLRDQVDKFIGTRANFKKA